MDDTSSPIPDKAEWQILLQAEQDHRRAKVLTGLEQARRGEAMSVEEARASIKARLDAKFGRSDEA